jgi:hypothetical protein
MSALDQQADFAGIGNPNGATLHNSRGGGAVPRHSDPAMEPELEGSSYQTAPITALALARWTWAVIGMVLGLALGYVAAGGGGYQAVAMVKLPAGAADLKTTGTTFANEATSDPVLALAATFLDNPKSAEGITFRQGGGVIPRDEGSNAIGRAAVGMLGGAVKATWQTDTNLVSITTSGSVGKILIAEANAVARATVETVGKDVAKQLTDVTSQYQKVMNDNTLSAGTRSPAAAAGAGNTTPEEQRRAAVAQDLGAKQASLLGSTLGLAAVPTNVANPAGVSPSVSGLLGGAGGAFLGALVAVAAGAGRRRPHSPRELASLAPDLTVRTTVQAGELAGRVLETSRRSVVVLALPDTKFPATQLSMAIAHHLRTHGATVAVVDRVSDMAPSSAHEERLWALRRDVRRNVPMNFSADMLVVVCSADEEALSLIAGQSDLLVAVVAKQKKTSLGDIRRTVEAVEAAEPVVVLAR